MNERIGLQKHMTPTNWASVSSNLIAGINGQDNSQHSYVDNQAEDFIPVLID